MNGTGKQDRNSGQKCQTENDGKIILEMPVKGTQRLELLERRNIQNLSLCWPAKLIPYKHIKHLQNQDHQWYHNNDRLGRGPQPREPQAVLPQEPETLEPLLSF